MKASDSEAMLPAFILAMAGGFLDAYTYLTRGGVFANAQTGNIVLIGISFSNGDFSGSMIYAISVFAFFIGTLTAMFVKRHFNNLNFANWKQVIIFFEMIIIATAGMIPVTAEMNVIANILISFVCSLQVQTFRSMDGNAYSTTMCTGNLRTAAVGIYQYKETRDKKMLIKSAKYTIILFAFILGAAVGAFFIRSMYEQAVFVVCLMLFAAFLSLYFPAKNNI